MSLFVAIQIATGKQDLCHATSCNSDITSQDDNTPKPFVKLPVAQT